MHCIYEGVLTETHIIKATTICIKMTFKKYDRDTPNLPHVQMFTATYVYKTSENGVSMQKWYIHVQVQMIASLMTELQVFMKNSKLEFRNGQACHYKTCQMYSKWHSLH